MFCKCDIDETLADAVLNRPREFFIGSKRYCLWSLCLGATVMIQRHISALEIDDDTLRRNPIVEALRLSTVYRNEVSHIIAIATLNTYSKLSKSKVVETRAKHLSENLTNEELAQLLLAVLSEPKAEELIQHTALVKDKEIQLKISKIKNEKGNIIVLGGKTIFGSMIIPVCEKLHITPHQAVWEMPLLNLKLFLADAVNTVYLSDEELAKLGVKGIGGVVDADDAQNMAQIKAQDWS